jgi:CubicO group peptidase (beta-lactamase class C family)
VRGEPAHALPLASIGAYGHGGAQGTFALVDPKKDLVAVFLAQRLRNEERFIFLSMAAAAVAD